MENDLRNTVDSMLSEDYEERFKAEYRQLVIRLQKLETMCFKYANKKLDFKPKCSFQLLQCQLMHMEQYAKILRERAVVEEIDLH